MTLLDKILFEKVAPRQVRYLKPPDYARAEGLAREALDQMDRDFVIGPPVTIHISNPELMTGMWSAARECLAAGQKNRARGEVIAATISRLNACPYCFDIHTSMLHSFESHAAAEAVLRQGDFPDPKTQAAADWARATLKPGSPVLAAPPFSADDLAGVIGTAVCFHYLNRMANIFLEGSAMPLNGEGWLKGRLTAMAGRLLRPRLTRQRVAGGEFLTSESGALPEEFGWARSNPNVAGAFLRFANAAEAAGTESVAAPVRECVLDYIARWSGEIPEIGRVWLERAVAPLGEQYRPAARLALLAAMASSQVDEAIISDFRSVQPADRALINVTSWAVYTTVRRIASWIYPKEQPLADARGSVAEP